MLTSLQKTNSVPQTMMSADTRTLMSRLRVMMLSLTLRGGFLITSLSTGSTPKLTTQQHTPDTQQQQQQHTPAPQRLTACVPLSRRSVHDDVDPQDLHGVQRVGEVHQRCQGDERQSCDAPVSRRDDTVNTLSNKKETAGRKRACLTHVLSWKRTKFLMLL